VSVGAEPSSAALPGVALLGGDDATGGVADESRMLMRRYVTARGTFDAPARLG